MSNGAEAICNIIIASAFFGGGALVAVIAAIATAIKWVRGDFR